MPTTMHTLKTKLKRAVGLLSQTEFYYENGEYIRKSSTSFTAGGWNILLHSHTAPTSKCLIHGAPTHKGGIPQLAHAQA